MTNGDFSDESCGVFGSITDAPPQVLLRFIVGEDSAPRAMTPAEIGAELGDAFAGLLAGGTFPASAEEVLTALDQTQAPALGADTQRSFVLGEGSQLPVGPGDVQSTNSGLRFLVSRGSGVEGPDVVISASHPHQGLVELMAWDRVNRGFNYYRTVGDAAWVFAGNSRQALADPTQGKGPFESHPSGNLIMKELRFPWVHWHSFKANIFDTAFPAGDVRRTHPWFTAKQGAETCETAVVMPSIRRWTDARFDIAIDDAGSVQDPARFVSQIVQSPTVNLASSARESASVGDNDAVDLPPSFFVDSEALSALDLPAPPAFAVSGEHYRASLATFGFLLTDGDGFSKPGDAHFAFVVPERAFEDNEVLRQSVTRGLVSKRLAAALLMVDFPNPVFSARRAELLKHAPTATQIVDDTSPFSEEMANRILAAADQTPEGSPEREFRDRWSVGEEWPFAFGGLLQSYYGAIQQRLATADGFNNYVRLADSRRNRVREMPIGSESSLLLPETNIPAGNREMKPDATVADVA